MARGGTSSRHRQTTHGSSPEAGTGNANETRRDKKDNRVAIVTAFIGLITAVITLGAAVVPLLQSQISRLSQQVHAQLSVQLSLKDVSQLGFTCTSADTLGGGAVPPWPGPSISLANASV